MKTKLPTLALLIVSLTTFSAVAQVPGIISHQGKITVDGTNYTGAGQFKFALVNAAGDTTYWSNDGTSASGDEPASTVSLPVARGIFSVNLGDITVVNMTQPITADTFTNSEVYLRVWFSDGVNGSQQLMPDRRITSVGYALKAASAEDYAASPAAGIQPGDISIWNAKVGGSGTANVVPRFTASGIVGDSAIHSDDLGNVGIGLSNPAYQLDVSGDLNVSGQVRVNGTPIGATGPQGPEGAVGPQGLTGEMGSQGPEGQTGPQGLQGLTGNIGPEGPQGLTGTVGPEGPMGPQGFQGLPGEVGAQGPAGMDGTNGLDGVAGATGPQGPEGAMGAQGLTGEMGPQGSEGQTGPQGLQGLTGNIGPEGPQGLTGTVGPEGPMGPQGFQGLPGEVGAQGPAGWTERMDWMEWPERLVLKGPKVRWVHKA